MLSDYIFRVFSKPIQVVLAGKAILAIGIEGRDEHRQVPGWHVQENGKAGGK
jgi:hypothetical protein